NATTAPSFIIQINADGTTAVEQTITTQNDWVDPYNAVDPSMYGFPGQAVNIKMAINSSFRTDGVFLNAPYGANVTNEHGLSITSEHVGNTTDYNGMSTQITRQYITSDNITWYLASLNNRSVWIDSRAFTTVPFTPRDMTSFVNFSGRKDGIFTNAPYGMDNAKYVGNINNYQGQSFVIGGQYYDRGITWNLIQVNGQSVWVDNRSFATNFTHDTDKKVFVNTTSNLDGLFLNAPYRQPGYKLAGLAKNYNNQTVTVSQQYFDDQGTVWSQVVLGGQTVWVDNHALAQMQVRDTNQQLYVNSNGRNDGLFLNAPYRGQGSQLIGMTADYNGQHVQVTKQGQDAYGAQWRLITLNNQQVWVDSRALSTTIMQAMNDDMYVNSSQRTDGLWLNAPYTMSGAKWAGDTRSANGRYVHISKAYSNEVGNTYYLTNLNGQSTWIDKRAFTTTFDQVVALNATIVARQRPDGMFKTAPYGEAGAQFVDYVTNYSQQTVPVTKQHSDAQGNQWYLATVNGTQYWIDQRSFSPVVTKVVDYQAKIVPRTTRDGVFSGAPYGEVNAKLVNMATAYQNQVVHATGEYTNASGITWSQFALSGQEDKLWIDKRALQA
uniref:GW dipeptide domain-containing protein n=1 Tax=Leuconostoc citreum TaxID=33964 RepID=UPI0015D9EBD7